MTTLEELEARHREELAEYNRERERRFGVLEQQQKDLLGGLIWTDAEAYATLQTMLREQRQASAAAEKDELDLINHFHALERESFFEKQAKRNELAKKIITGKDRTNHLGL